ncbi:hypothetical protein OIV83_000759 [Microbotryomycetes sp. JL201]|nr:hypothetical protein OIV83_000759 [Microbotryomycetes sp. JL201]
MTTSHPDQQAHTASDAQEQPSSVSANKPRQARHRKPAKRRGAKIRDDDDDESELAQSRPTLPDSDSDFEPELDAAPAATHDDDEEDDDDDDEDELETVDEASGGPVAASKSEVDSSAQIAATPSPLRGKQAKLAQDVQHPSWSDMPADGQEGTEDLPALNFDTLTPGKLASLPAKLATTKPASPSNKPTDGRSKKAQIAEKRQARLAELKKRDPEAYEAQQKAYEEKLAAKKKEKLTKLKEKRKDRKQADETATSVPASQGLAASSVQDEFDRGDDKTKPPRNVAAPLQTQEYEVAREAYSKRLAEDPSYVPRVGRFWSHDDRLATPEVRPLVWRGAIRGGDRGGFAGRGRGRGAGRGRGGFVGREGRDADSASASRPAVAEASVPAPSRNDETVAKNSSTSMSGDLKPAKTIKDDDSDDDGWGRGEVKKAAQSAKSGMPAWKHDGFEELARDSSTRGTARGGLRGRGRGTGRGGIRSGFESSFDEIGRPIPGAVNPRYAHLPFHPHHRFAGSPRAPGPAPSTPKTQESATDVHETAASAVKTIDVRLPGALTATKVELATTRDTDTASIEAPTSALPDATPASEQTSPHVITAYPTPPLGQQPVGYAYHVPGMQPAYYQPRAYPTVPTPGATPPPAFTPGMVVPPQSAFFAPPRTSKIEIKAPVMGPRAGSNPPRSSVSSRDGVPTSPQMSAGSSNTGYPAIRQQAYFGGNPYETYSAPEGFISYEGADGVVYFDRPDSPQYHYVPSQYAYYPQQQQMYYANAPPATTAVPRRSYPHQNAQQAYPQNQSHHQHHYQQPWIGYNM